MTEATHKWIPVEERLPEKSGTLCLVAIDLPDDSDDHECFPAIADFHHGKFEVYDNVYVNDEKHVRFWMLFPVTMPPRVPMVRGKRKRP